MLPNYYGNTQSITTEIMTGNQKAMLWAVVATGAFSIAAALGKIALTEFHAIQILFIRQFFMLVFVMPFIIKSFPDCLKTRRPFMHGLRLLGAFTALLGGFWAIKLLPLTTAIVIGFSRVFLYPRWHFMCSGKTLIKPGSSLF